MTEAELLREYSRLTLERDRVSLELDRVIYERIEAELSLYKKEINPVLSPAKGILALIPSGDDGGKEGA